MTPLPFVLAPLYVTTVRCLSPSFVRIEFGGAGLANFGVDGRWYDQRVKIIFPPASGQLPDLADAGADWYAAWLALPDRERGAMRTYSVRDVHGTGADTRLVVDFVLHLAPGASGPASTWANAASIGDEVLVLGPRRGHPFGGIEFSPGDASRLLFAADETAVPALSRILADLCSDAIGDAFCEVPHDADTLRIEVPPGIDVRWLPRNGAAVGSRLIPAVLSHLEVDADPPGAVHDEETAQSNVWETPRHSTSAEEPTSAVEGVPGLSAWVAGESGMVTILRRHLVHDVGIAREQVAFMGYWREGVAMGP